MPAGSLEPVQIQTERLRLRLPRPDDAARVVELVGDPVVMRFIGSGTVVPPESVGEVVEKWRTRWSDNGMGPFVVERRADGRFLGRTGILVWDARDWTHTTFDAAGPHAQPELGWALVRAGWGNGYATEAARAVRDWARLERGVARLVSLISPDNPASQRVARRLGASPVETVRLFDTGEAVVWEHPDIEPSDA